MFRSLLLLFLLIICISNFFEAPPGCDASSSLTYTAKFVGNFRVKGKGYTTTAHSLTHCLAICNKDKSCDGINYFTRMFKCRILTRCSSVQILNASSFHKYYTKRPPVAFGNYTYEEDSDTCLKITPKKTSYETAVQLCNEDVSRLLVISTGKIFDVASKYLRHSELRSAWVNYSAKRNKVLGEEYADKIKQISDEARNGLSERSALYGKTCWVLWIVGILEEVPCSGSQQHYSICQLTHY